MEKLLATSRSIGVYPIKIGLVFWFLKNGFKGGSNDKKGAGRLGC